MMVFENSWRSAAYSWQWLCLKAAVQVFMYHMVSLNSDGLLNNDLLKQTNQPKKNKKKEDTFLGKSVRSCKRI